MASLFLDQDFQRVFAVPESEEDRKALITRWHKEKTAIYQQIISSGAIPPRSGIKRIAEAALAAGWKLAVASTSAKPSVEAVLTHVVGESTAKRFTVLAGDVVVAKKPAPDIRGTYSGFRLAGPRARREPAFVAPREKAIFG
jgi:phosphoglycolate phosphatase-like HAD superfamily hydrolase